MIAIGQLWLPDKGSADRPTDKIDKWTELSKLGFSFLARLDIARRINGVRPTAVAETSPENGQLH
jgi:hypothetical protein